MPALLKRVKQDIPRWHDLLSRPSARQKPTKSQNVQLCLLCVSRSLKGWYWGGEDQARVRILALPWRQLVAYGIAQKYVRVIVDRTPHYLQQSLRTIEAPMSHSGREVVSPSLRVVGTRTRLPGKRRVRFPRFFKEKEMNMGR